MAESIKLSPNHGLNPTIPICFWCGEEKNEIAIMGKINKNDDKMPMHVCLDYEPCESCRDKMNLGVTVIEATATPNVATNVPIQSNAYPTGRWSVVTRDFINRITNNNPKFANTNTLLMDKESYDTIFANVHEKDVTEDENNED